MKSGHELRNYVLLSIYIPVLFTISSVFVVVLPTSTLQYIALFSIMLVILEVVVVAKVILLITERLLRRTPQWTTRSSEGDVRVEGTPEKAGGDSQVNTSPISAEEASCDLHHDASDLEISEDNSPRGDEPSAAEFNLPDKEYYQMKYLYNIKQREPHDLDGESNESQPASTETEERKIEVDLSSLSNQELIELLRKMSPYVFEKFIADLWECQRWNTTITSETGDRGIDVIAERHDLIPEKQLIQAKKYANGNRIGSTDVQLYSSLLHQEDNVDAVIIITTSSFTQQAKRVAKDLNVKLVDKNLLCRIIESEGAYGIIRRHSDEDDVTTIETVEISGDSTSDG